MSDTLVQIQINGANLVIIGQQVRADLAGMYGVATWKVTVGPNSSLVFTDQASGMVLSDTGIASSSPAQPSSAVIAPAGSGLPVTSWNVVGYSDSDGDNATAIKDPSQLTSGYYTVQDPGSGKFLFRNQIEDRSLLPKSVCLQDPSQGSFELVMLVVSN